MAVAGLVVFRERLTRRQIVGLGIAVIGFVFFTLDQRGAGIVDAETLTRGNWMILGAAAAWAFYAVLQKHLTVAGWAPQDLNLLLYLLPAITLWPLVQFRQLAGLSPGMWALLLFLGVNTLLAYGALGEALKRLPAYQVSVIVTLNPLITLGTMALLRKLDYPWVPADAVSVVGYGAALLVIGGILFVLWKPRAPVVNE